MMRKLVVFSAVLVGLVSAPIFAQILTGSRDGTSNVTSDRIGMPGGTPDPLSQYQTQRAMNNLPGPDARVIASLGAVEACQIGRAHSWRDRQRQGRQSNGENRSG